MKNVHKPLAKSVLIPLGLIAAASAADAGIQKKKSDLEKKHWQFQTRKERCHENSQISRRVWFFDKRC